MAPQAAATAAATTPTTTTSSSSSSVSSEIKGTLLGEQAARIQSEKSEGNRITGCVLNSLVLACVPPQGGTKSATESHTQLQWG